MFGSGGDGGLGMQLLISQTVDDVFAMWDRSQENGLLDLIDRLRSEYNRLLTAAQSVDRALQESNRQLAAAQNDLAVRTRQLEAVQSELKAVYARNEVEAYERRQAMISRQDWHREQYRVRLAGSQST